jgi:esterase
MDKKINYKVFGEGEPVVIMHGLLGMLDNWQTFAKNLAKKYMVCIIDLRNHGKSFHSDEMDYLLMAEDLREFMELHHMFNAHLLGHSMGGKVAMKFAFEHPDMVSKLIVADISPSKYPGGHESILEALLSVDLAKVNEREEVDNHLMDFIGDRKIVLFLMKNLSRVKEGGFRWKANLDAISNNYENILDEINSSDAYEAPTLFIKGERSNYLNEKYSQPIRDLFPGATVKEIPGAGHWVHSDDPETTLKYVEEFLEKG